MLIDQTKQPIQILREKIRCKISAQDHRTVDQQVEVTDGESQMPQIVLSDVL